MSYNEFGGINTIEKHCGPFHIRLLSQHGSLLVGPPTRHSGSVFDPGTLPDFNEVNPSRLKFYSPIVAADIFLTFHSFLLFMHFTCNANNESIVFQSLFICLN